MIRLPILTIVSICLCACASSVRPELDADALMAGRRMLDAGAQAVREGSYERAMESYNLAFQLGKQAEALNGLGCVAARQARKDEALRLFLQAIDRAPTFSEPYGHIAALYEESGDRRSAEGYFQRGLALKPSDLTLRVEYAQFLARNGNKRDAMILMDQVRSMVPKTVSFRLKR